ncbi:MAG: phosphate ABC transporter substrate-binding/OmpA family protein, partial [Verrucomicrobiota bacterium]
KAVLDEASAALVDAENLDRKQLYGSIGSRVQPPLSAEQIGKLRAKVWKPDSPPLQPLRQGEMLFAMHGSNTIGAKLGPALAASWMKRNGATGLVRIPGQTSVECTLHGQYSGNQFGEIFVEGHGSSTAFPALSRGEAQVGMSSRPINSKEIALLKPLGDMQSSNCQFVVALDALPILVHPDNPLNALSIGQVRDIFVGKITDWSEVGGPSLPITRYSRDQKSGTRDTFNSLVLNKQPLAAGTREFEDNSELSDSVAADPGGIGYAGVAYVRNCKALAISAGKGLSPLLPTRIHVATEQYAISRRLYLYSPEGRDSAVDEFLNWAVSDSGQAVVEQNGFIPLSIATINKPSQRVVTGVAPYDEITAKAQRIPVVFRFRPGSLNLDSKAQTDLARLASYLQSDPSRSQKELVLVGFSEAGTAPPARLVQVSKERAEKVAALLKGEGVEAKVVTGFGGVLPIGDNATESGQHKNQRVEVYLADGLL